MLVSCDMSNWCTKHHPLPASSDTSSSVITTVTPHDSIIKIPPDSSWLKGLINCEGNNARLLQIISYQSGKGVGVPKVSFRHDTLYVECPPVDTMQIYLHWKDIVVKAASKVVTVKIQYVDKPLKWYQKWLMYCGMAFLGVVVFFIIKLVAKVNL